jgi:aspartyl-tRNA(Asn)/glutamyl-tRNA(Gln) amidotransferase subunit B
MEASALVDERDTCEMYESCIDALCVLGVDRPRAGKLAANWLLGTGMRLANERHTPLASLGISAGEVAAVAKLREDGELNNQSADELFGVLCREAGAEHEAFAPPTAVLARVKEVSRARGWLIVRDDAAMEKWIDQVLAVNDRVADDVRAGKMQAAGRLVGEVMKLAAGKADARLVRELILKKLGQG